MEQLTQIGEDWSNNDLEIKEANKIIHEPAFKH